MQDAEVIHHMIGADRHTAAQAVDTFFKGKTGFRFLADAFEISFDGAQHPPINGRLILKSQKNQEATEIIPVR